MKSENRSSQEINDFEETAFYVIFEARMRGLVFVLLCLFAVSVVNGQEVEPCATQSYIDHLETQYPGFRNAVDRAYLEAVSATKKYDQAHAKNAPIDTTYEVNVVFHVVYRTEEENVADQHIHEQLEVLNACFNRENADTVNTREMFKPVAGSARIRFKLASVDPEGNPTNGITRTKTFRTTFNVLNRATAFDYVKDSSQGGQAAWDSKRYLNVWVCNLEYTNGSLGLLGYAYPPVNADFWGSEYYVAANRQGVVLHYQTIGPNNPEGLDGSLYTREKTAVHEFGHYFGLRHVWGDARFNGCGADDYIDDTPNTFKASSGCNPGTNTCNEGTDDMPDQVENYMDYSNSECSNMFTRQQVEVMRYNLQKLRSDLGEEDYVFPPIPERGPTAVYPNPFDDYVEYFSEEKDGQALTLVFRNYLGQEVFKQTKIKNDYLLRFDQLDMAVGYYHLTLLNGDKVLFNQRVLKITE